MSSPSLDDVEKYHVEHLNNGSQHWRAQRTAWTDRHAATLADYRGLAWEGHAAEAALTRMARDEATAAHAANTVQSAEAVVWAAVGELTGLKSEAMAAIDAANNAGFVVNQDFSSADRTAVSVEQASARRQQAERLSADIVAAVEALYDHDATVAARLDAHGAQLDATRFVDGKPLNRLVGLRPVPVDSRKLRGASSGA